MTRAAQFGRGTFTYIGDVREVKAKMTALFRKLITYMMEDPRTISASIDLVFVAKAIERVGDHAKNIAEAIIYVVKGKARMRWGEALQFTAEAGPGDFIFVPPYVPHQEINASPDKTLECVLVRSDGEAVAVNLDIEPAEAPESVRWIDPTHPQD